MRKSLAQPILLKTSAGQKGTLVLAALRARADGYTITIGTTSTHVLNGAFYSLSYDIRRFERFCTYLAAGHGSIYSLCKENDDGKGAE
jgi:hypothetical protein